MKDKTKNYNKKKKLTKKCKKLKKTSKKYNMKKAGIIISNKSLKKNIKNIKRRGLLKK